MLTPAYEEIELRLHWPLICKVAVQAMCSGMDFERFANRAIESYLAQLSTTGDKE